MQKAFLCHSSKDKEYVRVVASRLGRSMIVFDEMSFAAGDDFREAIAKGLDDAALFVFFVSKASLDSVWCRYELKEAQYRRIVEQLEKHLVLIIDRSINFDALPEWLSRAKALIQLRPNQATRDIQHALLSLLPPQYRRPFVGRQSLAEDFAKEIAGHWNDSPRILIASGLEGIGRRSYLDRVILDNLALHLGPYVLINETHDLSDIYFWALDETAEMHTRSQMADEISTFNRLTPEEQVDEIIRRLNLLCETNCIPCIVDEGGLLNEFGKYMPDYELLIQKFCGQNLDNYLALVHRRSPFVRDLAFASHIIAQRIPPLETHETKLLLSQILRHYKVNFTNDIVDLIIDYLDGYPPAAYFAAAQAADYGLSMLALDRSTLVDFKEKRFTKFINDLKLSTKEWSILHYLCSEKLLPLEAISIALNESQEIVADALRNLIDHSLVVVVDEKYSVSLPIRDAIMRVRGYIDLKTYKRVLVNLTKAFWSSKEAAPSLEIVDATLHAVARSGSTDFAPYRDMVRVSTINRLAQECYYRQEWNSALAYAIRAENMSPNHRNASRIHFKSLVQLESWKSAETKLREIKDDDDPHALYLEGFMLRKRHQYREACKIFQAAMDAGDNSFAVHRDYADCLYRCGQFTEAKKNLQWVLERDSGNVFILDMMCRICIDGEFLEEAKRILQDLERSDVEKRFIHHRRARFFHKQNILEAALQETENACQTNQSPFEAYAEQCDLLIELSRFPEAWGALQKLEQRFGPRHKSDVQIGLRIKLLIRQNRWSEAKSAWDRLERKDEDIHKVLLAQIFELKGRDFSLTLLERENAAKEALELRQLIKNREIIQLTEIDDQFI